jgi:hypothetical protein
MQQVSERMTEFQWTIAKLIEIGVNEDWLRKANPTHSQARDMLKGLLYLKEWCKYNNQ